MSLVLTIGYEASEVEDFIASLQQAGVSHLLDVRALPLSRRRGFSKMALKQALDKMGIGYVHLPSLGDPKPGRDAARAGRYADFRRIFLAHLATTEAERGLQIAASLVPASQICLMCYERSAEHCHRSLVAEALSGIAGARIEHLTVERGIAGRATKRATRTGRYSRQGCAAA